MNGSASSSPRRRGRMGKVLSQPATPAF
jgi:hypothetical protein